MTDSKRTVVPAPRSGVVHGPVAEQGDVRLQGHHVAGRDLYVGWAPDAVDPPFLLVTPDYLAEQAAKDKRRYVARFPDWADVVHGSDTEIGFVERDQTDALHDAIAAEILDPCSRGTDGLLHALVVLGPPGAGKTTLLRRVLAMMVTEGRCVVADFGVSTEAVPAPDAERYESAILAAVPDDVPLVLLLDDPFYANSGWTDLLRRLSRRQQNRVAVVAASPDFLFSRFGHGFFDRRITGRTLEVVKPSSRERAELAALYGRDPGDLTTSDEDLLVVAMEAAAGESFRTIISRMWTTLNDGVPLAPDTRQADLPWPVVAFAVACYFHRNYVRCPEPLLRVALGQVLTTTAPENLAASLDLLVTREGWRIFSVVSLVGGEVPYASLIGATHARVAREALAGLPTTLDLQRIVIDASVRAPESSPQLAELILATQSSRVAKEKRFLQRLASTWTVAAARGDIDARGASLLVRGLRSSRATRLQLRPVLRACAGAPGPQNWLPTWQLCHLALAGSNESRHLREVALPAALRISDLSQGPTEALEIATHGGATAGSIVQNRLLRALDGELPWRPHATQVLWLMRTLPRDDVVARLEELRIWLEEGLLIERAEPEVPEAVVVRHLLQLLRHGAPLGEELEASVLDLVFDWLGTIGDPQPSVLTSAVRLAEARTRAGDLTSAEEVLERTVDLLSDYDAVEVGTWFQLLGMLRRHPSLSATSSRVVPALVELLMERSETSDHVWSSLLTLCRDDPALAAWVEGEVPAIAAWLMTLTQPAAGAWSVLLTIAGEAQALRSWAVEAVPAMAQWLSTFAEGDDLVWSALLTSLRTLDELHEWTCAEVPAIAARLREMPESHDGTWSALLTLADAVEGLHPWLEREIPATTQWLLDRPDPNEGTWSALLTLARRHDLDAWAEDVVPEIATWLMSRPGVNQAIWTSLLKLAGSIDGLAAWREQEVRRIGTWLTEQPTINQPIWSAVVGMSRHTSARDAVALDLLEWLKHQERPVDWVWTLVLESVRLSTDAALAEQAVAAALPYLTDRDKVATGTWTTLLATAHDAALPPATRDGLLVAALTWARSRAVSNPAFWDRALALAELASTTVHLPHGVRRWLDEQAEAGTPASLRELAALLRGRSDPF